MAKPEFITSGGKSSMDTPDDKWMNDCCPIPPCPSLLMATAVTLRVAVWPDLIVVEDHQHGAIHHIITIISRSRLSYKCNGIRS